MITLLMCTEDAASINIRDRLLEESDWNRIGEFRGRPINVKDDLLLVEAEGLHLYLENADSEISGYLCHEFPDIGDRARGDDTPLELLVFLSKHRSESSINSLTVHTPGNPLGADFGGEPGFLPPSSPYYITQALKTLYSEKKELDLKDRVSYEVTHHGPRIDSPCFFIEIGSDETRWKKPELALPIARTLLSNDFRSPPIDLPVAIGIGGGHYAPRFTDRAMRGKFAFGHMIPDYILRSSEDQRSVLENAVRKTPGAQYAFIHRSKRNRKLLEGIDEIIDDIGLTSTE